MALGGSTNSVLHLTAIANEAGITFPLERINDISRRTPNLCKLSPAGDAHLEDLDLAGGIGGVLKEVSSLLHLDTMTVSGKTIAEIVAQSEVRDRQIIRSMNDAYSAMGGLAILFGSLAPEGAVVKSAAVDPEMLTHRGPACVFDSEEEAATAIMGGRIQSGEVIVIRYEGPKGGPGMREMLTPTSLLSGMGLDKEVALITDGRFSGGSRGAAIGHISPEAASRGPIAAVKDGDMIKIDIPNNKLDVELSEEVIAKRLGELGEFRPRVQTGYLRRYIERVTSASKGAVFSL
jgi:dihydroxy-acid dehydratase